jgi:hypothetical protein
MKAPYAAMLWDRVLFQDKLDIPQILAFFEQYGDRTNPEQKCDPNAPPSAGTSAAPAGSASPVPSGSAPAGPASPAPSST